MAGERFAGEAGDPIPRAAGNYSYDYGKERPAGCDQSASSLLGGSWKRESKWSDTAGVLESEQLSDARTGVEDRRQGRNQLADEIAHRCHARRSIFAGNDVWSARSRRPLRC